MWLNGVVCAYWASHIVLAEYGGLAYRVICRGDSSFAAIHGAWVGCAEVV